MKKIELYNQISREIVKNYNTYLHPEDVKYLKTLEVDPHYTIVHVLKSSLIDKVHDIALKLKKTDTSLIINKPENYHITLFWKGLDSKLEEKTDEIEKLLAKNVFEFDIEELLFGPLGISLKFYPKTESFVNTRMDIHNLTNTPISINERFVTTWIHLATFSQIPNKKIRQFVLENSNISFGSYKVDKFTLFISTNKGLDNPTKIADFSCKL